MAAEIALAGLEFASVRVGDHTEWSFAELTDADGVTAAAEITCGDLTADVAGALAAMVEELAGRDLPGEGEVAELLSMSAAKLRGDRSLATAVSALRTALTGLQARRGGISVTELLGGTPRDSVPLYANVNRALLGGTRTPAAFAKAAGRAVRDGFGTVKCAPFDEVVDGLSSSEAFDHAGPGLRRVAAVRSAVGPGVRLLVDCHSRFDLKSTPRVAEVLARQDVAWFEEPLEPTADAEGLAMIAPEVPMPIAGGEKGYGEEFFADLVSRRAVEIVMPDVKHCGGVAEAYRIGMAALAVGARVSLHSPSGPLSQLAGAHATAVLPEGLPLEHAVNEAPWRADLLVPPERVEAGRLWFPEGRDLDAGLNEKLIRRYGRRWSA